VAERDTEVIGAVLVTLAPDHDLRRVDAWRWTDPPPEDSVARRLGRPHLTWVFVAASEAGRGVGTALLRAAAGALRALGFEVLGSSFMAGNASSTLWHWRNGFQLLPHPCSLLADHEGQT
jgi:GNAT superfamily N-acetyltransferase